jgi:hypothetical protein
MRPVLAISTSLALLACNIPGEGEGEVTSSALSVTDCWRGSFDLGPDFFASVPYRDTQQIRVQRGSDLQEVSDGVAILVNEVSSIRPTRCVLDSDCASGTCSRNGCPEDYDRCCLGPDRRGQALGVGLPNKLLEEVAPGAPLGEAPDVSMALYLQYSCHNTNTVLYAISGSVTFHALFNGDPNESSGAEKYTDAQFDVMLADPRDADAGTLDIPAEKQSPLTGYFRFFFRRGQPGQPFP